MATAAARSPFGESSGSQQTIRVLLADDHAMLREGIRLSLEAMGDMEVVAEAEDGASAVLLAAETRPDVVVLDVTMPQLNGIEALRKIKQAHPDTPVLILSMHDNETYVMQALQAGASGYVLKRSAARELASAIRAVHSGEAYLHPGIAKRVITDYVRRLDPTEAAGPLASLTAREREVLQLASDGQTVRQIAARLHLSPKTVEHHRSSAMNKLDLHSQTDLVKPGFPRYA
ncbi:MAG: DNA-binding response regulator [Dehalococcoidia bacterium]|nr:DNA-binding response regulator [Dehalococcoidia bacterium]